MYVLKIFHYYNLPDVVLYKRFLATCRSPKPFRVSRCSCRSSLSAPLTVPRGATASRENRHRSDRCALCRTSRWPGAANRPLRAATPLGVRTSPAPCVSSEYKRIRKRSVKNRRGRKKCPEK